jgi:hypothetical protein
LREDVHLKRSPLVRRTPLQSGNGLRRTSRLAYRSPKTAKLYREERVPLVKRLLAERPMCEAGLDGCTGRSEEIHELISRARGGNFLPDDGPDPDANFKALCHFCHRIVTDEPLVAESLGLSKHSWDR